MENEFPLPEVITISEGTYKGSSEWIVFANGTKLVETVSFELAVSHAMNVMNGYITFKLAHIERVQIVATNPSRRTRVSTGNVDASRTTGNTTPSSGHKRITQVTSKHSRLTDLVDSELPQRLFNKAIAERYGDDEFAITWVDDNLREIEGPYGTTVLIDATIRDLDTDGDPTGDDIEVSFSGPYIINMLKRLTKGKEYRGILIARLEKRAIEGTANTAWMLV